MQVLSLIPGCTLAITDKAEGPITNGQELTTLLQDQNPGAQVLLPNHQHTTRYVVVDNPLQFVEPPACDILLTERKQVVLAHQYADCVPIVLYDRKTHTLASGHGGWRGLVGGIIPIMLLAMQAKFGSHVQDLWVYIGPCIQKQSYVFEQPPFQMQLPEWKKVITYQEDGYHVDLPRFAVEQCIEYGVDETRIINDGRDTFLMSDIFYSHVRYVGNQDPVDKGNFAVMARLS